VRRIAVDDALLATATGSETADDVNCASVSASAKLRASANRSAGNFASAVITAAST
jgi:hypothetical protein